MTYEEIKIQFAELHEIILELNDKKGLTTSFEYDIFMSDLNNILKDTQKFKTLLELSGMSAMEIFIIILSYTGCDIKEISKNLHPELKRKLKKREIK